MLKAKLNGSHGVRFVRFDAFKYADVPLRRNFVSAVASELGRAGDKYHSDLYSGRTKTEISIPATTVLKLLGVFALLMVGLSIILGAVVAIVAWLQAGDFWDSFSSMLGHVVMAGLLPASLLASLIALASKTFNVDRSLSKPESDEQFEQLFRDIVADTGAKRLVVFVDELDRCSATEVVATLDTVRTFLGIDRCVFVIAADQNVLEEALTRAAKQETPANEANPYYSTGSAYLDKVFQYQMSLPPLLAQSVSNYATTLVDGRGGVWGEINVEYVLSVLVPTHVTSPRRVKHLLNTFALTYRLADDRYSSGLLSENPRHNAAAIARLVCLRVEFPLFARHLEVDPSLPDLVLKLVRDADTEFPAGVSDRVQQLARAYALDGAAPATILASRSESDTGSVGDAPDGVEGDEEGASHDTDPIPTAGTARAHNRQLLNYLSRTRQVTGPSRDLVYMQSTGTVFGLDGELALAVEQAAEDGDLDTLHRRVAELAETERAGVLELLSQQIRTGGGITGPNTARSFLLLHEEIPSLPVAHVVDAVAEAICLMHDDGAGVLDEDTVSSAWTLAKAGSERGAKSLRRRVIEVAIRSKFETSAGFLVDDALIALNAAPTEMADYLASLLVADEGTDTLRRLFAAGDDDVIRVFVAIRTAVAERANAAVTAHGAWTKSQNAAAPATTRATAASSTETTSEPLHPTALLVALSDEAGSRETPVQHETLRLLLTVDDQEARSAALSLIRKSEPVAQPELATAILSATHRRAFTEWPDWFKAIAPGAVRPAHSSMLMRLFSKLWSQQPPEAQTVAALELAIPLTDALPKAARPDLTAEVISELQPMVTDADEASARRALLAHTRHFIEAGLVDESLVAGAIVSTLQDTLAQTLNPVPRDDELYQYVAEEGARALAARSGSIDHEQVDGILSEAAVSPWIDDVGHIELPLSLAGASGLEATALTGIPDTQTVAGVVENYAADATHAATLWVTLTSPGADALALVLDRLLFEEVVSSDFAAAATQVLSAWARPERRAFLDRYLAESDSTVPADIVLETIGLLTAEDEDVADLLCDRFTRATNNSQRQAVVELWSKAGIRGTGAQKRLIETIVYGLLNLHAGGNRNASAVELALTALNNVGTPLPYGVKGALGQRVRSAIDGNSVLEEKALRVLPRLGYSTSRGGFLGRTQRLDYTEP